MTFTQQVLATLMGSGVGFLFGLALFLLSEHLKGSGLKRHLLKNVRRELTFDESLLSAWTEDLDEVLRQVTIGDRNVFKYLRYSQFEPYFMQQALASGLLYESLPDDDIRAVGDVLMHFSFGIERYLADLVQKWKSDGIAKQEMLTAVQFERDQVRKMAKVLSAIGQKLA